jgi:hypothetical protein
MYNNLYLNILKYSKIPRLRNSIKKFKKNNVYKILNRTLFNRNNYSPYLYEKHQNRINWDNLSKNEAAVYILEKNLNKLNWRYLSSNKSYEAMVLIEKNINNYEIDWDFLSKNSFAIDILKKNTEKINYNFLMLNESPDFLNILQDNNNINIYWNYISRNPAAINFIEKNLDKINWEQLSQNPAAIHLLEKNPDKINWSYLSLNPSAADLLLKNYNKIDSCNFVFNYKVNLNSKYSSNFSQIFKPKKIIKYVKYNIHYTSYENKILFNILKKHNKIHKSTLNIISNNSAIFQLKYLF